MKKIPIKIIFILISQISSIGICISPLLPKKIKNEYNYAKL